MDTKSYILPFEKIRQPTHYGDLETGVIPKDPYDCDSNALREGRILLLKTKTDVFIIGYLPQGWQVTVGDENTLRAHGPSKTPSHLHILEGNLKDSKPIDPWEECPLETPHLPWCKTFTVNLTTGDIEGEAQHSPWAAPLITPSQPPLALIPEGHKFRPASIDTQKLTAFNPKEDILTGHQIHNQFFLRALKLQKTWVWES